MPASWLSSVQSSFEWMRACACARVDMCVSARDCALACVYARTSHARVRERMSGSACAQSACVCVCVRLCVSECVCVCERERVCV